MPIALLSLTNISEVQTEVVDVHALTPTAGVVFYDPPSAGDPAHAKAVEIGADNSLTLGAEEELFTGRGIGLVSTRANDDVALAVTGTTATYHGGAIVIRAVSPSGTSLALGDVLELEPFAVEVTNSQPTIHGLCRLTDTKVLLIWNRAPSPFTDYDVRATILTLDGTTITHGDIHTLLVGARADSVAPVDPTRVLLTWNPGDLGGSSNNTAVLTVDADADTITFGAASSRTYGNGGTAKQATGVFATVDPDECIGFSGSVAFNNRLYLFTISGDTYTLTDATGFVADMLDSSATYDPQMDRFIGIPGSGASFRHQLGFHDHARDGSHVDFGLATPATYCRSVSFVDSSTAGTRVLLGLERTSSPLEGAVALAIVPPRTPAPELCFWQPAGSECDIDYGYNTRTRTRGPALGFTGSLTGAPLATSLGCLETPLMDPFPDAAGCSPSQVWDPVVARFDDTRAICCFNAYNNNPPYEPTDFRAAVVLVRDGDHVNWCPTITPLLSPRGEGGGSFPSQYVIFQHVITLDDTYAVAAWFGDGPTSNVAPYIALLKLDGPNRDRLTVLDTHDMHFAWDLADYQYGSEGTGMYLCKMTDTRFILFHTWDQRDVDYGKPVVDVWTRHEDETIGNDYIVWLTDARSPDDESWPTGVRLDDTRFQMSYHQRTDDNYYARRVLTAQLTEDDVTFGPSVLLDRSNNDFINPPPEGVLVEPGVVAWSIVSADAICPGDHTPPPPYLDNSSGNAIACVQSDLDTLSSEVLYPLFVIDGTGPTGDYTVSATNVFHAYLTKDGDCYWATWDAANRGGRVQVAKLKYDPAVPCRWTTEGWDELGIQGYGYYDFRFSWRPLTWAGGKVLMVAGLASSEAFFMDPVPGNLYGHYTDENYDWSGCGYAPGENDMRGVVGLVWDLSCCPPRNPVTVLKADIRIYSDDVPRTAHVVTRDVVATQQRSRCRDCLPTVVTGGPKVTVRKVGRG